MSAKENLDASTTLRAHGGDVDRPPSASGEREGHGDARQAAKEFLLRNDEFAVLALLGVSHNVIDKGIGSGLVEGHLDESALRREEV